MWLQYLGVGKFAVTPSAIDQVSLGNHFNLRLIVGEPDEAEALRVPGL